MTRQTFIGIAASLFWGLAATMSVGQSSNDPTSFSSQVMASPRMPILILNQERLLRGSKSGQALLIDENRRKSEHLEEGQRLDRELEAEEIHLTELRKELPVDEFQALAVAFDAKVVRIRREHQERSEALGKELDARRKTFFSAVVPIVAKIMTERGASLVFEQRNVLFTGPDVDITDEVIARMDKGGPLQ